MSFDKTNFSFALSWPTYIFTWKQSYFQNMWKCMIFNTKLAYAVVSFLKTYVIWKDMTIWDSYMRIIYFFLYHNKILSVTENMHDRIWFFIKFSIFIKTCKILFATFCFPIRYVFFAICCKKSGILLNHGIAHQLRS